MINSYKELLFIETPDCYQVVRGSAVVGRVFDKCNIDPAFIHLLGAAPAMYTEFNSIFAHIDKYTTELERQLPMLNADGKAGLGAMIAFHRQLQDRCLHMMRLAEIGTGQLVKEHLAEEKSKISS